MLTQTRHYNAMSANHTTQSIRACTSTGNTHTWHLAFVVRQRRAACGSTGHKYGGKQVDQLTIEPLI